MKIEAKDLAEAKRKFRVLESAAEEAVYSNEVPQFLDELDRRHRVKVDAGPVFSEFVKEWKETCVLGGGLNTSSIQGDLGVLKNHILPFFGEYCLRDIDPRMIDRYKATKRQQEHQFGTGFSAKTINNHLSVLHRIFSKAIEYGKLDRNPVTPHAWLKPDTTPEDNQNWWAPDEEAAAIATLEGWKETHPDERLVILTQLITGMRFSEIRALEKRDLDLSVPGLWVRRSMVRKEITVPKNKRARLQVIPKDLASELRQYMLKTEGQLLFPGFHKGPLANNTLNRCYRKLAAEAGIRPITSHGARHTSGSSYALMGAGQKMIAVSPHNSCSASG